MRTHGWPNRWWSNTRDEWYTICGLRHFPYIRICMQASAMRGIWWTDLMMACLTLACTGSNDHRQCHSGAKTKRQSVKGLHQSKGARINRTTVLTIIWLTDSYLANWKGQWWSNAIYHIAQCALTDVAIALHATRSYWTINWSKMTYCFAEESDARLHSPILLYSTTAAQSHANKRGMQCNQSKLTTYTITKYHIFSPQSQLLREIVLIYIFWKL